MSKTSLVLLLILGLNLLTFSHNAFAQIHGFPSFSDFPFFGIFGAFMLISLGLFVIHIVILIWVAQDAKARGMDDVVLWLIAVFLIGIAGLIVYLILRPKGPLTICSNCSNKRLEGSATCPHCGSEQET